MASAARLERLRKLIQVEVDALPDRAPGQLVDNGDASGGVAHEPAIDASSRRTATDHIQPHPGSFTQEPSADQCNTFLKDGEAAGNFNHSVSMPDPIVTTAPKPSAPLPTTNLKRGDLAQAQQHFTPIQALAKYPYRFCNRNYQQDVASAFFDQGKFWAREWDLYYVWSIDNYAKPLILVRETQFQDLLNEINKRLELDLQITDQQRENALVSRFPDHPRCTPRYLGRSKSREEYDEMINSVPDQDSRAAGESETPPLDEHTLEAFNQLMEDSFDAQRTKNKASKAKKQQERLVKQKSMADQFKRAQRYLGLRPTLLATDPLASGPPAAIDPKLLAPYSFDQAVVFVCIDVETYERAHHMITEVGVATLDTRELASVPPGEDGVNWRSFIHARHFRIKEHAHLVNSEFVSGHPEGFDFGESTFVSLVEAPVHIAACFSPPFGAHQSNGVKDIVDLMERLDLDETRNIILLGHDVVGDIKCIQTLGHDPMKAENLLEALDTTVMYRVWRREHNPASLGRILYDFDIAGYKLHNAGNDAVFTLQAMLAICVREASVRGSSELSNMRDSEKSARLAVALEEAQQKASNEAEGWSDRELEGDGGVPVPISIIPSEPALVHAVSQMPSNNNSRNAFQSRGRGSGRSRGTSGNRAESSNMYNSSSRRGDGRSNQEQPGRLHNKSRGSYDGRFGKRVYKSDSQSGRGRGHGSSSNTPENKASGSQVNYYW